MDIDQLRKKWQTLDINTDNLAKENLRLKKKLIASRALSISSRLQKRVINMAIISFLTPFLLVLANRPEHIFSIPTLWCVAVFMYIVGALQIFFVIKLRRTDIIQLPMVDAIRQVAHRMVLMRRIKITECILGCVPIFLMFHDLYLAGQYPLTFSGIVGGLIGVAVGLKISITNMRLLKEIQTTLREVEEERSTDDSIKER